MSDTTALAPSTINYGPVQLDRQKLALIGNTIAPDLTPNELALFGEVCMRKQLDPFSGQIHAIKRYVNQKVNGQWQKVPRVTFQTSQEGFLSLAERTAEYDGMDPPVFGPLCSCGEVKARGDWDDDSGERAAEKVVAHPEFATLTVYRRGFTRPISATSYWHEYYPGAKQGAMWHKMPRVMLAKVARVAALRLAFPYVMGGLLSDDEMQQADREPRDVTPSAVALPAPGVSEAAGSPPAAAIQPTPPAPSQEAPAAEVTQEAPPAAEVLQASPQTAPFNPAPLAGPSVSRRMGRSIGPQPKRTNVIEAPQASTAPATAPEGVAQPIPQAEAVSSQPAPSGLTDEVIETPGPAPVVDEGERVYVESLRQDLRAQAAVLFRINAISRNHLHALQNEEPEAVPPPTPTERSDEGLRGLIDRDYPGRSLENLGRVELEERLEKVGTNLAKKRALLKEKGITEE